MSYTITTGKHPGQPGACLAQYNHSTFKHGSNNPNHHNPSANHPQVMPVTHYPITTYGSYGNPSWRPPGSSYPFYY
ncbi:MAG: hypothetical protein ABGX20_13420 [Bacillus sp. (in: firmicutes)]|jgi:hypothetical protein